MQAKFWTQNRIKVLVSALIPILVITVGIQIEKMPLILITMLYYFVIAPILTYIFGYNFKESKLFVKKDKATHRSKSKKEIHYQFASRTYTLEECNIISYYMFFRVISSMAISFMLLLLLHRLHEAGAIRIFEDVVIGKILTDQD